MITRPIHQRKSTSRNPRRPITLRAGVTNRFQLGPRAVPLDPTDASQGRKNRV